MRGRSVKVSDSFTSAIWTCCLATLPARRMVNNEPAYPAPITRMRVDDGISCTVLRLSEAGAFELNIRILQTLIETFSSSSLIVITTNEEGRGVTFVTSRCLQGAESLLEFRGTRAFASIQT